MPNGPSGVSFKDLNNYQQQNAARIGQELETQRKYAENHNADDDAARAGTQEDNLGKDDVVTSQAIRDYGKDHGWDTNEVNAVLHKFDKDGDGMYSADEFDKMTSEMQDHEDQAMLNGLYQQYLGRDTDPTGAATWGAKIKELRAQGMDDDAIKQAMTPYITGSPEYLAKHPPASSAPSTDGTDAPASGSSASSGSSGTSGASASGSSSGSSGSSTGAAGTATDAPGATGSAQAPGQATTAKAGDVPYINQYNDSLYNNGSNCGPTSMAMIARAFGYGQGMSNGQLIADLGKAGGTTADGTGWAGIKAMAAQMGKNCEEHGPDTNWIAQQLQQGKLVCCNGDYFSMPPHNAAKQGQGGHYVAIVGMDANGNFLVNDPADSSISPKAFTPAQIQAFMQGNPNGGQAFAIG